MVNRLLTIGLFFIAAISHSVAATTDNEYDILLTGEVNDKMVRYMYKMVNAVPEGKEYVYITIDSMGGYAHSMIAICDMIDTMKARGLIVVTLNPNKVVSAAAIIYLKGDFRYSTRDAIIGLHKAQLDGECMEKSPINTFMKRVVEEATGSRELAERFIKCDMTYIRAYQAKKYKLTTDVL